MSNDHGLARQQERPPWMSNTTIPIELTPEDRSLLLRYGYPHEPIERELLACEGSDSIVFVPMDSFYLEKLIGDLCYSINRMKSGSLQNRLIDLCERLESAERYGDGTLYDF